MHENMKNHQQELQNGWALVMVLIFSVTRTVQLFSRVPGTCGMWHFGVIYVLGFVIQLLYYQMNVEASGQLDAIPDAVFIFGNLGVLMFHNLAGWWRWSKGYRCHSWCSGLGVLHRFMPRSSDTAVAVISDILVAALLSGICYLFACPILSGWYLSMIGWCLLAQGVLAARKSFQLQRLDDAQFESDAWSADLRERQYWAEMQRERWGDRYE